MSCHCTLTGFNCRQGRDCPERARPVRYITTPAGVRIGSAYTPKPQRLTADQERMQAALLEPRTATPRSFLQRLLGALWRFL